jgi:hypothetical protein
MHMEHNNIMLTFVLSRLTASTNISITMLDVCHYDHGRAISLDHR